VIELGRLVLGCAPLGGLFAPVDEAAARATVDAAWEAGIRAFDTAPLYGCGVSERRLGAALSGRPRDAFVLSTKVGRRLEPASSTTAAQRELWPQAPALAPVFDFSRDGVLRSLEASLERLGLDHVDVVLIHDPDDNMDAALTEAYPALDALRAEGVVRAIGAGMNQAPPLVRFVSETDIDCVLVAGRYTLLDQTAADELLPACLVRGVSVLAGGVFNSGVLARAQPGASYDYQPVSPEVLRRARRAEAICAGYGVPLASAAMAFPLRHPAVSTVIVGARSPEEIARDAALFAQPLPDPLWDALAAERLRVEEVPA
jgi:D-threo-aldose 1-dehydrogenase